MGGDSVRWLNLLDDGDCAAEREEWPLLESERPLFVNLLLRISRLIWQSINSRLCPSLIMASVYPPSRGACFKRHLDSPKGEGRLLTAIFYANAGWALEHGSTLRAWTAGSTSRDEILEVLPMADRLVVFLSEDVWHEVTPN